MQNKQIIPIFYASDENYLPYLSVSLSSLKANASKSYAYHIYILNADVKESERAQKVFEYADENFKIEYVDVSKRLEEVKESLKLRDYYTGATYYRIFIANMFPQYEKALYLDSDTIVLGDIAELYNKELGDNLVGAIPDGAVGAVPEFRRYTKEVLGVTFDKYFNAGVLLMNLAQFRKENFYDDFCALLKEYKFSVAQDQDYLNVICKDKVAYIGMEWNQMPIASENGGQPKLIHYNLTMKPWHYENILYKEHFWKYARKNAFYTSILSDLQDYTQDKQEKDAECEVALRKLCIEEAEREDNFLKARQKANKA